MIPHQPIFTNIQDRFNLGDMLCNAKEIFPEFKDSPMVDFREVTDGPEPLIVGGGGMIHPGIDMWIRRQAFQRMVFLVGVGVNYHKSEQQNGWQTRIRHCSLAGIRDKSLVADHDRFLYCPCPTAAMADWDTLRAMAKHEKDLLVLQHYDFPIKHPFPDSLPRVTNRWTPGCTITQIATELGKYRRVVTNTYHGALWSARMGWSPLQVSSQSPGPPVTRATRVFNLNSTPSLRASSTRPSTA